MASPGEITLLALGPLTNVALALSLEPRLADALASLVLMGGAVLTHGNTSEVASANLYNDPEAAAIVYQSGAPIVQVGLDVCRKAMIPTAQWDRIRQADSATLQFLTRITPHIANFYAGRSMLNPGTAVAYNDVPAVAYLFAPELFAAQELYVRIATHDELTKGQTVADLGNRWGQPPNARVLLDVRGAELTALFADRLITKFTDIS
ncbi:MAG: nucleoside hydrolase, partial [Anaerolineales bacterium]|nr:nucleoside hydrolase [Anaerolineales bacterium]